MRSIWNRGLELRAWATKENKTPFLVYATRTTLSYLTFLFTLLFAPRTM
jgi:hypothetical protein